VCLHFTGNKRTKLKRACKSSFWLRIFLWKSKNHPAKLLRRSRCPGVLLSSPRDGLQRGEERQGVRCVAASGCAARQPSPREASHQEPPRSGRPEPVKAPHAFRGKFRRLWADFAPKRRQGCSRGRAREAGSCQRGRTVDPKEGMLTASRLQATAPFLPA